jgi:hypothetical protein
MARAVRSGLSILAAVGVCASLATACGDDDDEQRAAAQRACQKYYDPCTNCTCRVCLCSSECEQGFTAYTECVDGCYSEPGGEAQLRCFDACEAAAPASTQGRLECAARAVDRDCASACR